jgi:hypothetical protein
MNTRKDKETNEFLDPEDWKGFINYISDNNRFILSEYWEKFVNTIVNTAHKRTKTLKKNKMLFRARLGTSWEQVDDDGNYDHCPIPPDQMGPPPKKEATAGRLNPEQIPYLYLASTIDTAVAEVRPWINSDITIGYFEIASDLKILDTSHDKPSGVPSLSEWIFDENGEYSGSRKRSIHSFTPTEKEKSIWGGINTTFSRPISPNDSPLKYLPTQFLSEKLKAEGYDGIAYKSSLNEDGYNIALFDSQKAKCIGCRMYEIKKVTYDYEESGNPTFLSNDGKNLHPRIVAIEPLNEDNREKLGADGEKSHINANSIDAKSSAID